jgi:hypothetical protein
LGFPTGVGGVIYPPGSLDPRVTDTSIFMRLCPGQDDLWFYWMGRLNGVKYRRVPRPYSDMYRWKGSQETGIFIRNVEGGENDKSVARLVERFGFPHPGI